MPHHIERDLQSASHYAHEARGDVAEARELQKRSRLLKVCIFMGIFLIVMFLLFIFFESDACYSMSIC